MGFFISVALFVWAKFPHKNLTLLFVPNTVFSKYEHDSYVYIAQESNLRQIQHISPIYPPVKMIQLNSLTVRSEIWRGSVRDLRAKFTGNNI